MRRRWHKNVTVAIIIIVCIALVGSSLVAITGPIENKAPLLDEDLQMQEYEAHKEIVASLESQLAGDPENKGLQIALANAYMDKTAVTTELNYAEAMTELKKAIDIYEDILEGEESNDIRLQLATALFYCGENEAAGEHFEILKEKDPEDVNFWFMYGTYVFYALRDYAYAESIWEQAKNYTTDDNQRQSLESFVQLAREVNLATETTAGSEETGTETEVTEIGDGSETTLPEEDTETEEAVSDSSQG